MKGLIEMNKQFLVRDIYGKLLVTNTLDVNGKWYKEVDNDFTPKGAVINNLFIEEHAPYVIEYEVDDDSRFTGQYLVNIEDDGIVVYECGKFDNLQDARAYIFENY